jgi:hypothetical protein
MKWLYLFAALLLGRLRLRRAGARQPRFVAAIM